MRLAQSLASSSEYTFYALRFRTPMPLRCESSITVCFRTPAAQCVICGRHFCAQHGDVENSVCRLCKASYRRKLQQEAAAQAEIERREEAEQRNTDGNLCG